MHGERVDPHGVQLVLLILHQRDQRTHHNGKPGQHQCGELVDERLPASSRHHDDRIAPVQQRLHRLPLAWLELHVPEALREYITRASGRRVLVSMLRHDVWPEALFVPRFAQLGLMS